MLERGIKKGGQVTLFVIFGVLILVGVTAFFMLLPDPEITISPSKDPQGFVQQCIENNLKEVLPEIEKSGGYLSNPPKFVTYQDEKVAYHCFSYEKRKICLRTDGLATARLEEEIKNAIMNDVEECFESLYQGLEGFDVEMGETNFEILIEPGKVIAQVRKEVLISREGSEDLYSNFDVSYPSDLFDFMKIANEILNQEVSCDCPAESCTADVTKIMRDNKDYKITFFIGSYDDKVYTIEDYYDKNKFMFAVRNCDKTP